MAESEKQDPRITVIQVPHVTLENGFGTLKHQLQDPHKQYDNKPVTQTHFRRIINT